MVYYLTGQTAEPAGIVEGAPGVFYSNSGSVRIFSVTIHGNATLLASFPDPPNIVESIPVTTFNALVYSSLEQVSSAPGEMFSVGSMPGTEQTYPASRFAFTRVAGNLPDTKLFGLAYNFSNNSTNLAAVDLTGNTTPIYQFSATDRLAPPMYASDGNYYGVSQPATSGADAYFYRVTPTGSFTNVVTLPFVKTSFVGSGLILQGNDGNFYGVQSTGLRLFP